MAISPCDSRADERGRELLTHGTALLPVACYHDDLCRETVPWHWHDELEAVLVTEGTAVFAVDQEKLFLRAGEGCLINAGVLHAAWNAGEDACRLHSLVFHPRLVGGTPESIFWQKYLLPILENRSFRLLGLSPADGREAAMLRDIEEAWQSCAGEPHGYEFQLRTALSRVVLALQEYAAVGDHSSPARVRRNEERLKLMLAYIRRHLEQELTIGDIARAAAVSESECIRCFRAVIGSTPIRYVKQLRLQRAAELLKSTHKKIAEIAADCGFQEMSYFSRAFREQFGKTPSEYRSAQS